MVYVFRSISVILVAALAIYLLLLLAEWKKPAEEHLCTLENKKRETQFDRIAVKRREHTLYSLIFRTDEGKKIEVRVSEDVYQRIPKGRLGTLCHKGMIFRWFSYGNTTIHYYTLLEDEGQGEREDRQS